MKNVTSYFDISYYFLSLFLKSDRLKLTVKNKTSYEIKGKKARWVFMPETIESAKLEQEAKKAFRSQQKGNAPWFLIIICHSKQKTDYFRSTNSSAKMPAVIYISFQELQQKTRKRFLIEYRDYEQYEKDFPLTEPAPLTAKSDTYDALIKYNEKVGTNTTHDYYKLRFRLPQMPLGLPGQFIMITTAPLL